ncbi:MAG TPA: ATP-binding cassette domain-containing protein [Nitrososphaera sp.]|nr:ATP-binding cassette domain-containing protein [Nitrososphaera sp.]
MQVVNVDRVSYKYEHGVALENISFSVDEGDIMGMIGPNGAGKTTLFSCMLGILQDYQGKIAIFGEDIKKNRKVLKQIGYVP